LPGVLIGVGLSLAHSCSKWRVRATPCCGGWRRTAASTTSPMTKAARSRRPSSCTGSIRPILFANARYVADRLRALVAAAKPPTRCIVLDMQAVSHIDITALHVLRDLHAELESTGIDVRFARANRPLREQLLRWIGDEDLGMERFFPSASAAVDDFLASHPTKR
jgi:MFS superfamily sulfate permease-like transporter